VSEEKKAKPATLAAQALGWVDRGTGAVIPGIHPSTTYERAADGSYLDGREYTRDQNPTYDQAEALLAQLESGEQALLYASGMAAAAAVFDTLEAGAHVVASASMYWSLRNWLRQLHSSGRIDLDLVDTSIEGALEGALKPGLTRLVWIETPANPLGEVTDIEASAAMAHEAGALVAVDSTVSTPVHTRPLTLGCDLVFHSATKSLNGHSDVLAGALVAADRHGEHWQRIRDERGVRGAVLGPFEAWLLLRGMRTLYVRVPVASSGALRVAEALSSSPRVSRVFYPGLESHPGHEVALRQMSNGFGALLSFQVRGGEQRAREVASGLRLFKQATSLGGVESLVEHRASVETGSVLPRDLLRLSVGIEDTDDLIDDLLRALSSA
jgi:cystathionine gamma-synthase